MTSRVAQSPSACDVVIPLFSIGGFLTLLVISPDFSLDLACAYSTFECVAGRDTSPPSSSAGVKHPRSNLRKKNTFLNVFEAIHSNSFSDIVTKYNIHFCVCFTICILLFDTF